MEVTERTIDTTCNGGHWALLLGALLVEEKVGFRNLRSFIWTVFLGLSVERAKGAICEIERRVFEIICK